MSNHSNETGASLWYCSLYRTVQRGSNFCSEGEMLNFYHSNANCYAVFSFQSVVYYPGVQVGPNF